MKSTTKILALAALFVATTTGFAASPASFGSGMQGFYAGADAGAGYTNCSTCSLIPSGSTSQSQFAANIFGGYQLNQYFAVEAGWGSLPGVEYKLNPPLVIGNTNNTASATHFYGALKAMLPLPERFGLFGKVGYDYMSVSSTTLEISQYPTVSTQAFNASGILLAAGASYAMNSNFSLTLAYNQLLDSHTQDGTNLKLNVTYGTLGLTYLF